MKKIILILLILLSSNVMANFSKRATVKAVLVQDDAKQWSPITGQKITDYYKTSFISKLKSNGRMRQYSSIVGLVIDMQESGIDKQSIKALDVINQKYINAKDAFFLINSSINPTFGKSGILAFKDKNDAMKYSKKYGGTVVKFQEALHVAQKSLKSNLAYMRKIYKKKMYPMGEKIYRKRCKKIDLSNFIEINELKSEIVKKNLCGKLNEKYLQALALYIWDVKREGGREKNEERVQVTKNDKCPVCGMFVYKYPRWATQIFYKHANHEHHLSFDGVKDMMKFYFNSKKWGSYDFAKRKNIIKMLVTDYYSQKAIDARDAYFVMGSNIYGPMGNELIPFANKEDAQNFKIDHKGVKILSFKEITEKEIYKLDNH